jgi:hypothetical protein
MPNRSQYWRARLSRDYALVVGCIMVILLAALIWFLWMWPDLVMYFLLP